MSEINIRHRQHNPAGTGFLGCFGGTLGIMAAMMLVPMVICGGCIALVGIGGVASKNAADSERTPAPRERNAERPAARVPNRPVIQNRDDDPPEAPVLTPAELARREAAEKEARRQDARDRLAELKAQRTALASKLAERQATYDRRIKAGGSDAQTLAEIKRLKQELTNIETEIAGLDLE